MPTMKTFSFLLLTISVLSSEAWYTCDQVEFCKEIRNREDGSGVRYIVDESSAEVGSTFYRVNLTAKDSSDANPTLTLLLTALSGNTFRIYVTDPGQRRHIIPAALDGEPRQVNIDKVEPLEGYVDVEVGDHNVHLYLDPFGVEVFRSGAKVMSINARQKMVFNSDTIVNEAIALDVQMRGRVAYGIPEHAERLALKNTKPGGLDPYRLFNVDYPGYNLESREALYGAIPVLYAHGSENSSGIFWLNSAQTFVDIDVNQELETVNSYFISQSGAIDLFFFTGPTLADAVKQYTSLTGTAPLPQLFALGFHQSRWSYMTQEDVLGVVEGFDKNNFPLDVMWLDIDYTDGIKYFTWNTETFPDPLGMQETLHSTGRKMVVIIDPHIKVEDGYWVYEEAKENGHFVKFVNGSDYQGSCWPGLSSYVDFLNAKARRWYASLYSRFPNTTQNTYIWNDMNEPSVFDVDEKTMPLLDVQHSGNWLHRDVHNAYGFYQTKGTYEGLLQRSENKLRPFVLTRSHFAGSQRYTAMWTGDNNADWPYLRISAPMCLTEALAGMSFCGADVGGFNNDVEDELFQRWYQLGAWLPFFRVHSSKDTKRREPYLYPDDVQERLRTALRQRYAHLPYWYTLWFEHTRTRAPVIRPLSYEFPRETDLFDIDTAWMVGPNVLVSPVMQKGQESLQILLPTGANWYRNIDPITNTSEKVPGGTALDLQVDLDTVPVFYRAGSIVPRRDTERPSSQATHDDEFSLYVFLSDDQTAQGNLYVDDYESFAYRNKEYLYLKFEYANSELKSSKIDEDADYPADAAHVGNVYVFGQAEGAKKAYLIRGGGKVALNVIFDAEKAVLSLRGLHLRVGDAFRIAFE